MGRRDSEAAARAARVLARALNRAQRFEEAVEVLDRAASALDAHDPALMGELEAGAVIAGFNDPAMAPSLASRRKALRERAAPITKRRLNCSASLRSSPS